MSKAGHHSFHPAPILDDGAADDWRDEAVGEAEALSILDDLLHARRAVRSSPAEALLYIERALVTLAECGVSAG